LSCLDLYTIEYGKDFKTPVVYVTDLVIDALHKSSFQHIQDKGVQRV